MQKFRLATMLLAMLFYGVTKILASPAPSLSSLLPNYTFVDASWQVQLVPRGPMTTINGTIQQVKAQIAISNPDWKFGTSGVPTAADIPVRFQPAWSWCGKGHKDHLGKEFEPAFYNRIDEGMTFLKGAGMVGVAKNNCARISCSYESAIHWCNDNDFDLLFHTSDPLIEAVVSLEPCT